MTNEDFQRRKNFLFIQQAQSEARLRRLKEIVTRFEEGSQRQDTIFKEKMIALRKAQARTTQQIKLLTRNTSEDDKGNSQQ